MVVLRVLLWCYILPSSLYNFFPGTLVLDMNLLFYAVSCSFASGQ